ncbi:hypothetical protein B566_EDAN005969 [Ephemera danica]|nr:hypothetical protein B566_EDAN005969 [Ephemera danica]
MLPSLEASTVREVTSWDAVEDSMRLKLVQTAEEGNASCLMDAPTSQAFEDALCATQQAAMEPPPPENQTSHIKPLKLACGFCHKPFSKKFDLEQHIRSHTGEKPFQCVVCGRAFSQKSNVKKHMLTHKVWPKERQRTLPKEPIQALVEEMPASNAKSPDKSKQVKVIVDRSYVCQYCEMAFATYFELKTHMKEHAEEKVYRCIQKNCNSTFSDLTAFLEHTRCHEASSQFRCHACGKCFASLAALGTHHYAHTSGLGLGKPCSKQKPKDFSCTKCKSKFATPEALDHHMHSNSHKYECNLCMKVFACERYLRRHLQTHASESSMFSCDVCSKEFRTEHYLRTHKITHSTEKPHKCGECSASFNRKDKLSRHLLTHETLKRKNENSGQASSGQSTRLRRRTQQVCHKCQSPVQWTFKQQELQLAQELQQQAAKRSVRKGPKKKVAAPSTATIKGMSTIEIIVVPMSKNSNTRVNNEPIQLSYEPAQTMPAPSNMQGSTFIQQQQQTAASPQQLLLEPSSAATNFSAMLVVQGGNRASGSSLTNP